jgi:hypothetical protein
MVAAWLVCKMIKIQAVPSCWLKDTVGVCIVIILIMSYRCTKDLQLILQNEPNQSEIQMGAENLRLEVQLRFIRLTRSSETIFVIHQHFVHACVTLVNLGSETW